MLTPDHDESAADLGALLRLEQRRELWEESELEAILDHQLNVSLAELWESTHTERTSSELPNSIRELLCSGEPDIMLLEATKNCAKSVGSSPESGLPKTVMSTIYVACIAAALVHLDMSISNLSDKQMTDRLNACLKISWLPTEIRELFDRAVARLNS